MCAYELDEATEAGAFLLGRRTYDRFNGMPTYVVSGTLTDPAWHNTTVLPDVDAVATLREGKGGSLRERRSAADLLSGGLSIGRYPSAAAASRVIHACSWVDSSSRPSAVAASFAPTGNRDPADESARPDQKPSAVAATSRPAVAAVAASTPGSAAVSAR